MTNFSHKRGDTFKGAIFTINVNDEPLDLTGATILCQLKKRKESLISVLEFSTDSGITITDPTLGTFQIEETIIDIDSFKYHYDIQITLSNGNVITPVEGIFEIEQDVSR